MFWFVRRALPVMAAAVYALPVFADTITLTNDKTLEGHAVENGDTVIVEMPQGTIKLHRSQIKSIVRKETPLDEFNHRLADLQQQIKDGKLETADQIKAWLSLAEWAGDKELPRSRADAYKKVLDLDPDNTTAREALGYTQYQGRWMTQTERYQAMGLVHFEGRWISKDALADIKSARDKEAALEAEVDRAQADAALKQAEIEKLQAQRDLLQAQRKQLAAEQQQDHFTQPDFPGIVPAPVYGNIYSPIVNYPTGVFVQPQAPVRQPAPLPAQPNQPPVAQKPPTIQPPGNVALPRPPTGLPKPPQGLPTPGKLPAPTTPPSQILQPTPGTPPNVTLPGSANREAATAP